MVSSGVLPSTMSCFRPRTEANGLRATAWRVTRASKKCHSAASARFRVGSDPGRSSMNRPASPRRHLAELDALRFALSEKAPHGTGIGAARFGGRKKARLHGFGVELDGVFGLRSGRFAGFNDAAEWYLVESYSRLMGVPCRVIRWGCSGAGRGSRRRRSGGLKQSNGNSHSQSRLGSEPVLISVLGTMFQGTHLPLQKWFCAIALIVNAKKSLSSYQLGRDLNLNQRSA